MEELLENLSDLTLKKSREEFQPIRVEEDSSIVEDLYRECHVSWCPNDIKRIVTYTELDSQSSEYTQVETNFFRWLSKYSYKITSIQRIINPFLYVQYQLKRKQKALLMDIIDGECLLFHGTRRYNIDSICRNNFDWRKLGANGLRSSKFGRGVSFSPSSSYASDYPRRCAENPRAMLVVKVLYGNRCNGYSDMLIPPLPADTSVKPGDGHVVVKYFDNEFYPDYVIYYESIH